MAETRLVSSLEEDSLIEEKEKFFNFDRDTIKRPGVICRIVGIFVCLLAIVFTVVLPTITIEYKSYSNSTQFDKARALAFPAETIYGPNALFGGGYYGMYVRSNTAKTAHILVTKQAFFNWILFVLLLCLLAFAVLAFFTTFTKKFEKMSKLVILGFSIGAFAAVASPVWFMVTNSIGNQYAVATTNLSNYWFYDSFYCHCAWGAIVAAITFVVAAVLFGVGTALENKGGERGR